MKRELLFSIAALLICGTAFAAVGVVIDNTIYSAATDVRCHSGTATGTCSMSGSVLTFN